MEKHTTHWKSTPIFSKPTPSYSIGRTAQILKQELQHHQQADKSMLRQLQIQLQDAFRIIQNLSDQKQRLKQALSDTLQKKEQLFNQAKFLYNQLNESKSQNLRFRKQLSHSQQTIQLLSNLREGLNKRDKIIHQLCTNYQSNSPISSNLISKIWQLTAKTHQNHQARQLYTKHFPSGSLLRNLIQSSQIQSIAMKLLDFVHDILDNYGKQDQQLAFYSTGLGMTGSLPMQINRATRINQEMASTMERSKEILSNPSSPKADQHSFLEEKPAVVSSEPEKMTVEQLNQPQVVKSPILSPRNRFPKKGKMSVLQKGRWSMGPSSDRIMPTLKTEQQWNSIQEMFNSYLEEEDTRFKTYNKGEPKNTQPF